MYLCMCVDGAVQQSSSARQQVPAISLLDADAESADSEAPPAHVSPTTGAAALWAGRWVKVAGRVESSGPPSFPPGAAGFEHFGPPSFPPDAAGFQHFEPRAPPAAGSFQHFGPRAPLAAGSFQHFGPRAPPAAGIQHFGPRAPPAADSFQHIDPHAYVFPSLPPDIVDMDDNVWANYAGCWV